MEVTSAGATETLSHRARDYDTLVGLIHAAALDAAKWQDFADVFSEMIGGNSINVWLRRPDDTSVMQIYRSEPELGNEVEFQAHWARGLPWGSEVPLEGPGSETTECFVDNQVLFPNDALADTDYYREWLRPRGMRPMAPIVHVFAHEGTAPTGAIGLWNREGHRLIDADDVAFANRLCPHLILAYRVQDQLRSMRREQDVFRELIDRLPSGLILVDENGRVVVVNESARLSIDSGRGLRLTDGRPFVDDPVENDWLQGALDRSRNPKTRAKIDPATSPEARVAQVDGQTPMWVTPLLARPSKSTLPDTAAMIFLGNPKLARLSSINLLRTLYELTRAEAELTLLIVDGHSLEEAARSRGVTVNTARSQLKRVFAKTGASRQADLVRIVMTGVGAMR